MVDVLTELHGREIGLTDDGALVVRSGIISTADGSPVSFPDGIDYTEFGTIPQNLQRTVYTLVLADAGKHIYHPDDDPSARTWTIPANSSVEFEIGHVITFVNHPSAGVVTISCGDTMWLAGSASTGNRTLAAGGIATAMKVDTTKWVISGSGLS